MARKHKSDILNSCYQRKLSQIKLDTGIFQIKRETFSEIKDMEHWLTFILRILDYGEMLFMLINKVLAEN